VARSHPDYDALRVANTILGRFGMMGRLGETVREEQGLAYYCSSALQTDLVAGAWVTSAGVNPANVEQAIDSILAEFQRLAHEPVTAQELSDSQAYMTGIVPLSLETNAGVAQTLYNMEWFNLGLDYLQRYSSLINAITVEDVQRVAQTYLRGDAYALVVAGPHEV
ncbi:MAG: insulinase family protein, partial [Caldilineaceae bacterium]|nr:insulinase family protein [Caldilineaceae bacterium]